MAEVADKKKKDSKKSFSYDKETSLHWYEMMLRIRRFEYRALQMYGRQKIRGFCHVYIGQEAVAAGISTAIKPTDPLITGYRQHGTAMARGIPSDKCMAELYGKANDINKGKGGSMHFFSREHNYFGGNGIVGATLPIGTGMGLAEQYRDSENISITMFGDGAARQGAFHESLNMAMTWKLPVLYICENNQYAMGTSVQRQSNVTDLYKLGQAYEMPSEPVNGMEVDAVHEALKKAAEYVRSGKGPYLLEMKTYRYKGHSVSDPANYRPENELEEYKQKDPIEYLKGIILDQNIAEEEELDKISDEINDEIKKAIEFAENGAFPPPEALYEDNYVQEDYPFIRD